MRKFLGVLFTIFFVVIYAIIVVKAIHFKQDCRGYLQQAANANTVELAYERLALAIDYAEQHNLTEGYTSVLWRTEDENVEFWYRNLKACQSELEKAKEDGVTQLEKTNLLMKVRESLTDSNEKGSYVITPAGLSRYPDNALWGIMRWLAWILLLAGTFLLGYDRL